MSATTKTVVRHVLSTLAVLTFVGAVVITTGCQTVKGVGDDVKNAGEAGERAINGK